MDSPDLVQQKQQFIQEIAIQFGFSGKKWDVFYERFKEGKHGLENETIAESLWSEEDIVDRKQTFQDHLKGICDRLAEKGCPINGSKERRRGRPRNEDSPWRIAYQWLWETKFPEWRSQNAHSMPSVPDWFSVCTKMLAKQQEDQRIRRRITEMGFEVRVYVPLGLVERKQQQRRDGIVPMEEVHQLKQEVITRTYKHDEFLKDVIGQKSADKNKHIAIVGEPGAGKTTLLDAIATHIQKNTEDLPICISLGSLQGKKLKDYILEEWLPEAIALTYPDIDVETFHQTSLQKRLRQGGVWLLLDGVDEMGETSPAKALESIQNQLTNWLGKVRVVLTCRTNVWDANLNNRLIGFDTYKTQHFYPADIRRFIKQWFGFARKPELGKILRQKLNEPQRDRIRQLVENPLRLALLCQVFHKDKQAELPETKAGLYELFVRYFYEWKPTQSSVDLTTQPGLKEELHQALGRLSIAGLDSDARFRLPESLVQKEMGDRLFKLAWEIGWLNLVDREATTDEPVYAFFHPTFQEYFAALAIDEADFFLPYEHEKLIIRDKYKPARRYRIFESDWKETFLFWLGIEKREALSNMVLLWKKEILIDSLLLFKDGCGGLYQYKAIFLASAGIREFNSYSHIDIILDILFKLAFNTFCEDDFDPIPDLAFEYIKNINCCTVVNKVADFIKACDDEFILIKTINILEYIGFGNQKAIKSLISIIESERNEYIEHIDLKDEAINCLEKIASGNQIAINEMLRIIKNYEDEYTNWSVARTLARIGIGNTELIDQLLNIIDMNDNELISCKAAFILAEIEPGNEKALTGLSKIIETTNNEELLGNLTTYLAMLKVINQPVVEALLMRILNTENELVYRELTGSLLQVIKNNQQAFHFLMSLLTNNDNEITNLNNLYRQKPNEIERLSKRVIDWLEELLTNISFITLKKGFEISKFQLLLTEIKNKLDTWRQIQLHIEELRDAEKINASLNKDQDEVVRKYSSDELYLIVANFNEFSSLIDDSSLCYKVIWHCVQNMSYPDFYHAWHNLPPSTHPEAPDNIPVGNSSTTQHLNFTQLPSILRSAINKDQELNQPVQLIWIDGSQFSDTNNPATDIYIEMVEQGCPEQQEEPSTMQQLKKYWRLRLKNPQKRVALLFYNSKADREFSETCLTALSTFKGAIAIITTQRCENVKLFDRNDPDLIDSVLKWLRRDVLES